MHQKGLTQILLLGLIAALLIAVMFFGYVKYIKPAQNENNNANSNINNSISIDLEPFKAMAREATCAEIRNDLYVIDGEMVYWDRQCAMADASYVSALMGRTPETVLCRVSDSFAGPQTKCNDESYREFFVSLNSGKSNLGLSSEHTIVKVMENGNDVNVKLIKTGCQEEVCAKYRYSNCPVGCIAQCRPSQSYTTDCDGFGSCICSPE